MLFVVVKTTERRKNLSEEWTDFITVNKYRFCISVIGNINMPIIGIGYKKSISVSDAPIMIFLGRFRYRFFSSKLADSDSDTDFFSL